MSKDLLAEVRGLVEHPDAATTGVWPRTAALLAREAIEPAGSAKPPTWWRCCERESASSIRRMVSETYVTDSNVRQATLRGCPRGVIYPFLRQISYWRRFQAVEPCLA
jgi:hypothetical protein